MIAIFVAIAIMILGSIWMSIAIENLADSADVWDEEMAEDRANLQFQIDYLESRMPVRFPEGGP